MKIINYFNEIIEYDKKCNENYNNKEEKRKIIPLEYKCKDNEFDYWLYVIKKTYGKFGEVVYENIEDELTELEKLKKENLELKLALAEHTENNLVETTELKLALAELTENNLK